MDKTIEQILVEVNFPDEKPFEDMYVGTTNAIAEAMKIAMKQAFEAGYEVGREQENDIMNYREKEHYPDFDDYFNKLEGGKDE